MNNFVQVMKNAICIFIVRYSKNCATSEVELPEEVVICPG